MTEPQQGINIKSYLKMIMAFKERQRQDITPILSGLKLTMTEELDKLIKDIHEKKGDAREQLVERLFDLVEKQEEFALAVLKRIDCLRITNSDGWMTADQITSYADTKVVIAFLELGKTDKNYKQLIRESHILEAGIEIDPFTLAISTLRNRNVDTEPYHELAREIKRLSGTFED